MAGITKHYFRNDARTALERARKELASNNNERLQYAALELRMAIEALTYDRAQAYAEELSPEDYSTWQPRNLLKVLLEIDPHANSDRVIHIGLEDQPGEPAKHMTLLGEDKPLKLAVIKKHYDALGNFLHIPTIQQIQDNAVPSSEKIRQRCEDLAAEIEKSLAATIHNFTVGQHSEMPCLRCGKLVRRRLRDKEPVEATCFPCGAKYTLTINSDKIQWAAQVQYAPCPKCNESMRLWKDKIKDGENEKCPKCETVIKIGLSLYCDEPEEGAA